MFSLFDFVLSLLFFQVFALKLNSNKAPQLLQYSLFKLIVPHSKHYVGFIHWLRFNLNYYLNYALHRPFVFSLSPTKLL
jgi:hypothetical protein